MNGEHPSYRMRIVPTFLYGINNECDRNTAIHLNSILFCLIVCVHTGVHIAYREQYATQTHNATQRNAARTIQTYIGIMYHYCYCCFE